MAFYLPLSLHRNGSFVRRMALREPESGDPINITGAIFALAVRRSAGAPGSAIASATVTVVDGANGLINVSLLGSQFNAVEGTQDIVELAYDLKMTQGGVPRVLAEGPLHLKPGVS